MRMNPGIKVTEVVKQIAKLWQSLTKEEKQHYKEAAKLGMFANYLNSIKIKKGTLRNCVNSPRAIRP
jgi:hypothetical protein